MARKFKISIELQQEEGFGAETISATRSFDYIKTDGVADFGWICGSTIAQALLAIADDLGDAEKASLEDSIHSYLSPGNSNWRDTETDES